ncbi:DUF3318 domain-containing protein [Synechococcus sp. PCC 7336]|uniref:DUF3318 domain-containing protein n=1 Tax=Synechococcus sp. PCC 7336 TaxID=195250 RepID=UPI000348060A|nr:DUF3318 domain-containing protein [Synechococcus sp. PCC 7336]
MYAETSMLDEREVQRLKDLLPASSRDSIEILAAPFSQVEVIRGSRLLPWQRRLKILIKPREWEQFTPNQRSTVFLHKVGYHSRSLTRTLDFYAALAGLGGVSMVVEGFQRDPVGIAVSGGLGGLAIWQLIKDRASDRRLLAADAYAVDRLVLRGLPRIQAVEALGQALHIEARLEGRSGNELLDVLRYQNLKRLAQRPAEDIVLS